MSKSLRMENVQQGKLEKHQGTNKSRCTFEFSGVTKITCPQFYWPHMPKHRAVGARPFTHLQSTSWFILAWKCRLALITPLRYIGWFVDSQVDFTVYLSAYRCLLSYFSRKQHLGVAKHVSYRGLSCWGCAVEYLMTVCEDVHSSCKGSQGLLCLQKRCICAQAHMVWIYIWVFIPSNSQRMPGPRDWIHRCLATPGIAWGNDWLMRRLIDWCIQRWDRPVLSSTLQNLCSPTQIPKKLSTTKQNKTERKTNILWFPDRPTLYMCHHFNLPLRCFTQLLSLVQGQCFTFRDPKHFASADLETTHPRNGGEIFGNLDTFRNWNRTLKRNRIKEVSCVFMWNLL